ncbi:carbon-nitrogen hydrolase family protein [soil metagenome]
MGSVRIAAVQMDVRLGDRAGNLQGILEHLDRAADAGAQLIAFPECVLTGYCFDSREEALSLAETIPGPSTDRLASACAERGVSIIVGLLERDGDRLYNACALIGPKGVIGSYRKIHLPFIGVDRFVDPGDRPFTVHEAAGLRIGMHICYDGVFPESGRVLSLLGADLLALPTNWPKGAEAQAEHLSAMRAMENVVYAMAIDRVGLERGFQFIGRSSIADPSGGYLAFASKDQEEILLAEIDPARARNKRIVRVPGKAELDRIADRRPDFYGPITSETL